MDVFNTYKVVIRMFMEFGLIEEYQIPYTVSRIDCIDDAIKYKQKYS